MDFARKNPSEILDKDIKDYLLYLIEKKQSATSTLNQAINALKFYYGTMLKKKFVYEVRRPRKDKKLPVVLGKEEVANILNSVDNSPRTIFVYNWLYKIILRVAFIYAILFMVRGKSIKQS